jgi:hypothetical protein
LSRLDRTVLDALLPSGVDPRLPVGVMETGFDTFLVESEAEIAPQLRRAFKAGLFAAAWVAPLLIRRRPPLGRLPAHDRERALEAMETSNVVVLRQLMRVLKTVVALHYGALPAVRKAIGYHA